MGVPAFYRWISEKYPKIIQDILEKRPNILDGKPVPINLNEPNPNGTEYDNLYIDMNGLIHPCSHPEDREAPKTEEEMYLNVTKYLDRLVAAIRPRKLLYLAIDGVAPRAKMNQQRSRRFKSAKEAKERKEMLKEVLDEMAELGYDTAAEVARQTANSWDSNVITPGTEFMLKISLFLKFYILDRMNKDPYWRGLTVILSDASEPGEGEHKIMSYIRSQRCQPDYNPNLHHVLHGLDADLIMLALATHEMHFTILREKVFFGKKGGGGGGGKDGGDASARENRSDAQRLLDAQSTMNGILITCVHAGDEWVYSKQLEGLEIQYLRGYLSHEFACLIEPLHHIRLDYSLERIIDDFIFLCFFVGNDFLPHLPSLDIRDGALDFLLALYKEILPSLGQYLTRPGGYLNLSQVDVLLGRVGEIEDMIFQKKKQAEEQNEQRQLQRKQYYAQPQQPPIPVSVPLPVSLPVSGTGNTGSVLGKRSASSLEEEGVNEESLITPTTHTVSNTMSNNMSNNMSNSVSQVSTPRPVLTKDLLTTHIKRKENTTWDTNKLTITDTIQFHTTGWKSRYYQEPHKAQNITDGGGLSKMCFAYIQGLCWVLQYYYQGVPSWQWYYQFHYAPFASDLVNIDSYATHDIDVFILSQPFTPIEQLLAVLPASSVHALPPECHWLMLDPQSPIYDLYDENIPVDPNGKHLPWLWILLLPFIDETRITHAYAQCALTAETTAKNAVGPSVVFVSKFHPMVSYLPTYGTGTGSTTSSSTITILDHEHNTGNSTGMTSGTLTCSTTGNALTSTVTGITDGTLTGITNGTLTGITNGNLTGITDGTITGITNGTVTGMTSDTLTGNVTGTTAVVLTCTQAHETSGQYTTLLPSSSWYVPPYHTEIPIPVSFRPTYQQYFTGIHRNVIATYRYTLPKIEKLHESALLSGALPKPLNPQQIHPNDFLVEKVPRLNRSGFNILHMFVRSQETSRSRNAFHFSNSNGIGNGIGGIGGNGNGGNYGNGNYGGGGNYGNNNNYNNRGGERGGGRGGGGYNNYNNNNNNNNHTRYNNNNSNYNNNNSNYSNGNYSNNNSNNYNNRGGGGGGGVVTGGGFLTTGNMTNHFTPTTTGHTGISGGGDTGTTSGTVTGTSGAGLACLRPQPNPHYQQHQHPSAVYRPPTGPSLPTPLPQYHQHHHQSYQQALPVYPHQHYPPPPPQPPILQPPPHDGHTAAHTAPTHRMESLRGHPSIQYNVGKNVSSRPTRTVLLDTLPGNTGTSGTGTGGNTGNSGGMQSMRNNAMLQGQPGQGGGRSSHPPRPPSHYPPQR